MPATSTPIPVNSCPFVGSKKDFLRVVFSVAKYQSYTKHNNKKVLLSSPNGTQVLVSKLHSTLSCHIWYSNEKIQYVDTYKGGMILVLAVKSTY